MNLCENSQRKNVLFIIKSTHDVSKFDEKRISEAGRMDLGSFDLINSLLWQIEALIYAAV